MHPARPDLPLFSKATASDDAPLIGPPVAPRAPLAVRKPGPAIVRVRSGPAADADDERESDLDVGVDALQSEFPSEASPLPRSLPGGAPAGVLRRAVAGAIDLVLLGAIDGTVVYLTLRALGMSTAEIRLVPPVPLVAFLLLLDGGYLAIFTAAGGQTIGKMSTGIRVVPAASGGLRVPFGTAVLRAAAFAASVLPLGLGLVPILLTPDRRAFHDRLADTRVVQA
jgi:uncharacterized RDD family membrane protein YckC